MKATIALILVSSTALVACTRIIERPAPAGPSVVTTPAISERVIEKQTPAPAATGSTAAACTWASQSYSAGATSCQDHSTYRCNNGSWEKLAAPAC
jgi:hypothetical protein